jgi:sec-independent protein translocase protein TatB
MLSLSPAKLLVILVIALIVLGPDKLPNMARSIGAAWHDLRKLRGRLESEVRGAFPDLPSTQQVAQAVRSPIAYLDSLADEHAASVEQGPADAAANGNGSANTIVGGNGSGSAGANGSGAGPAPAPATGAGAASGGGWPEGIDAPADDPSMN